MYPLIMRIIVRLAIFGTLFGCHQKSQSTVTTSSVKGVDVPGSSYLPYHPDRVVTFAKPDEKSIFTVDDHKTTDAKVKFVITPDDLKNGQVKCTITDCTIVINQPLEVSVPVPMPLGMLNIEITTQSTEQTGHVTEDSKVVSGNYQVNLFLTELDLGLGAKVLKKDHDNNPETALKRSFEDINCSAKLKCQLPFIYIEAGLNERGVIFRVSVGSAGQSVKYATINHGVRDYSGTIPFKEIPHVVCKSTRNLFTYLKKTYPKGHFADQMWEEIVNERRAMCKHKPTNPCTPH